jgi:hypothetical protein
MNTYELGIINGANNHITDISPLSSITNPFTSVIHLEGQVIYLEANEYQGTDVIIPNVSVDLDGVSPITSFESLNDGAITSQYPVLINGTVNDTGSEMSWADMEGATYTSGYKVTKRQRLLYANMTYSLVVVQDINLIAPYTVTYHENGATGGEVPVDQKQYYAGDDAIVLGKGNLVKAKAEFVEWNTQADGSGDSYKDLDSITSIQANVELYAIWKDEIVLIPEPPIIIPEPKPDPEPVIPEPDPEPEKPAVAPEPDKVLIIAKEKEAVATSDNTNTNILYSALGVSIVVIQLFRKRKKTSNDLDA